MATGSKGVADRILLGNVITLDPSSSRGEAIAICGNRILSVGRRDDVLKLKTSETEIEDLGNATIMPGFNDTHAHLTAVGLKTLRPTLQGARSIADVLDRVRRIAADTPKGEWIVTMPVGEPPYYFEGPSILAERRMPNRYELDQAAPDHPVYLSMAGGYWGQMPLYASMNSRGLALNGIDRHTAPSADGVQIERDANGEPTGIFTEKNFASVTDLDLLKNVPPFEPNDRVTALRHAMKLVHSKGTTSVYEGHGSVPDVIAGFRSLHEAGELTVRTALVVAPTWSEVEDAEACMRDQLAYAQGNGIGDDMLRISGVFLPSYGNKKNNRLYDDNRANLGWSDYNRAVNNVDEFERLCRIAHKYNLRVHTVVSDRLHDVVPALQRLVQDCPLSGRRWVMEHISKASMPHLVTLSRLGVGATLIPANYVWKTGHIFADTAEAPIELLSPAKALIELGVPVAASTDGTPYDPLVIMWSMVTRLVRETGQVAGPGGCLSNEAALRLLTVAGAWFTFEETVKGPLSSGYYADLAVMANDPLAAQGEAIMDNTCLATMVGGRWVYRKA
jgi:predicted amidohydrolase YtcJ